MQGKVLLAVTEDGLSTQVAKGENGGRTLHHAAVVRTLQGIGGCADGKFESTADVPVAAGWNRSQLKAHCAGAGAEDDEDRGSRGRSSSRNNSSNPYIFFVTFSLPAILISWRRSIAPNSNGRGQHEEENYEHHGHVYAGRFDVGVRAGQHEAGQQQGSDAVQRHHEERQHEERQHGEQQ